jgi:hypothetical protein
LGYSKLLSSTNQSVRLNEYEPNSLSLYMPDGSEFNTYLQSLLNNSILDEQLYYCQRFVHEIGQDPIIQISPHHFQARGQKLLESHNNVVEIASSIHWPSIQISDIGNVSSKSMKYHELHIASLVSGDPRNVEVSLLDCTLELLEYIRIHHPIGFVRSMSNVVIGLHQFCSAEMRSGYDSILNLATQLKSEIGPRQTIHQRETNLAMKSLVLAVYHNDYTYGLKYLNNLVTNKIGNKSSNIRIMKIYRLLSYKFDILRDMRDHGQIPIKEFTAIISELEDRERKKYKYKKIQIPDPIEDLDFQDPKIEIEISLERLFQNLEEYIDSSVNTGTDNDFNILETMNFDIDIDKIIDATLDRLQLTKTNRFGYIDLDDDEFGDEDGW